ncbi:MAG: clostripain-related cysteine peptidase [Firmicutes bacterium]|nr:clostripain-related cysteine peptidase [Bacillota bacterium]
MKRKKFSPIHLLYLIPVLLGLVLYVSGCNAGTSGDSTTQDDPVTVKSWTFMVYMAGDNDLEAAGWLDLNEMEQVGTSDSVNVIVQFDRSGLAPAPNGKGCGRYVITRNPSTADPTAPWTTFKSPQVEKLGNVNSGDPDTLVDFVEWGMKNYPANKYAVIVWNHGSGWRGKDVAALHKGICYDDTSNDYITENELKYAFGKINESYGKKIEFIGMDACLMGMLEVAYDMKDYGKYLVGSEVSISAYGWPYHLVLADLVADPSFSGKNLASSAVTNFKTFYEGSSDYGPNSSIVALKLSGIADLATAVNDFSTLAVENIDAEAAGLKTAFDATQKADSTSYSDFKDLRDFMYQVTQNCPTLSSSANAVIDAQASATSYYWNGSAMSATSGGLSIWLPNAAFFNTFDTSYEALSFGKDNAWYTFLTKFVVQ